MAIDKSSEVNRALKEKGFPDEFCAEIAYKYMNTEFKSLGTVLFDWEYCRRVSQRLDDNM